MSAPTPAADRQRAYRRRQRRGIAVLAVEVEEFELIEALLNLGYLDERRALDRAAVTAATARAIADLVTTPNR